MDSLHLPITLAYAKGAYTVPIEFGSQRRPARLVLDTGSSTLVVLPHVYDPAADTSLAATSWAQEVRYGQGIWAGPVLRAQVNLGHDEHARQVDAAQFALVEAAVQDMRGADGIFGLAYRGLDTAHDMQAYLQDQGTTPALTWPWPFTDAQEADLDAFGHLIRQQPRVPLTPLFSTMAEHGLVRNRFAMLIRRALAHVIDDAAHDDQLAADPLNRGMLVIGGGEECEELHDGAFRDVQIVHDLYYNAHLVAVQVGDRPRIAAPELDPQYETRAASNAIIDTGCSFVILEASLYQAVLADFGAIDARLPALVEQFQKAFFVQDTAQQRGVPNADVDALPWPDLHFILQAPDGGETVLTCRGDHYWPRNALRAGQACFLLMSQLPHWPNQSILGLPMMADHYCLFDRGAPNGGCLRVAKAHPL